MVAGVLYQQLVCLVVVSAQVLKKLQLPKVHHYQLHHQLEDVELLRAFLQINENSYRKRVPKKRPVVKADECLYNRTMPDRMERRPEVHSRFTELAKKISPDLRAWIEDQNIPPEIAEEIVQDALLFAYQGRMLPKTSEATFFERTKTAARQKIQDYHRNQSNRRRNDAMYTDQVVVENQSQSLASDPESVLNAALDQDKKRRIMRPLV